MFPEADVLIYINGDGRYRALNTDIANLNAHIADKLIGMMNDPVDLLTVAHLFTISQSFQATTRELPVAQLQESYNSRILLEVRYCNQQLHGWHHYKLRLR